VALLAIGADPRLTTPIALHSALDLDQRVVLLVLLDALGSPIREIVAHGE
jgi:hypothetical protein